MFGILCLVRSCGQVVNVVVLNAQGRKFETYCQQIFSASTASRDGYESAIKMPAVERLRLPHLFYHLTGARVAAGTTFSPSLAFLCAVQSSPSFLLLVLPTSTHAPAIDVSLLLCRPLSLPCPVCLGRIVRLHCLALLIRCSVVPFRSEVLTRQLAGENVLELRVVQCTAMPTKTAVCCAECRGRPRPKLNRCTGCFRVVYCNE